MEYPVEQVWMLQLLLRCFSTEIDFNVAGINDMAGYDVCMCVISGG